MLYSKVFQVINYYTVYTYIPMFFFKLKDSMAFTMCSHMAMTLRLNQTSTNRISRRGQVPNSNHHSLLDGTAGLTRLQVQQKTANRISWNNNVYIYIYFFLGFQLSDSFETNLYNTNYHLSWFVKPEIHLHPSPPAISHCKCRCFDSNSKLHPPRTR